MNLLFDWIHRQTLAEWVVWSLLSNFAVAGSSIVACHLIHERYADRPVFVAPQPLTTSDRWLAVMAITLNSVVSIAGWLLWKAGWITLTFPEWWRTLLDLAFLLLFMDAGMYVLHRFAHVRAFFRLIHQTHHVHESTNALSLFVLNPLEVLGFGALLLFALVLFPISGIALLAYLTLNIAFGTLGHAGVEPIPPGWFRFRLMRQIGTSTFHGLHHADPTHNFGFYTVVWDRLFRTIHPEYDLRTAHRR